MRSIESQSSSYKPTSQAIAPPRVLFLPKNSRNAYFRSFLTAAHATASWDVQVVCASNTRRLWHDIVREEESFHLVPDFNKPQTWENHTSRVAEIDAFVAACEQASGVSAGRIILAGERDLGRGYSWPIYHWYHNDTARRVLADNTESFRIVRRMFAFARDTLEAARPDIVLTGEWADPLCFTFSLVARHQGIRCVVNRYSKVWNGRCFWSASPTMYNHLRGALIQDKRTQNAPVSVRAREHIRAFRERPAMIDYVRANWEQVAPKNWLRQHENIARAVVVETRHRIFKRAGAVPKPGWQMLRLHYRRAWLEWRNARFFRRFDERELASAPYIYIALHKDPEQTLNYQAPYWTNQMYTVGLLSSCLPYGYKLFVREHRANVGRRPSRFYKDMAALPGVVLIDGYDDQFKYIRHADSIITENGSSGWEGLLLGRRVITLADTFYDGTGLELRVREPEHLATKVVERLELNPVENPAAHDQALGWLLDAEWETSALVDSADHAEAISLLSRLLESTFPQHELQLQTT